MSHAAGSCGSSELQGQLCKRCKELHLDPDSFLVERRNSHGSGKNGSRGNHELHHLRTGNEQQSLGLLRDITSRRHGKGKPGCPFCNLVADTLSRYNPVAPDDTECFIQWEIDGRINKPGEEAPQNVSRLIRLSWAAPTSNGARGQISGSMVKDCQMEAHILYVPPPNPFHPMTDTESHAFLAREFDLERGHQALMKDWLDKCEKYHEHTCGLVTEEEKARFLYLTQTTSFGVIDVVELRLKRLPVEGSTPARFVALSYVWGDRKDHRTLRSNVLARLRQGGLENDWDSLPKTIQDAIELVRDLGERYLWIDAICIVQDSVASWRLNSANMDLVYGSACLTICAADGRDSDAGLVAMKPGTGGDTPLIAKLPKLSLLVTRPLETVLETSVWNSRGWTFQERLLSRRCLIFAGCRVYFQCRSVNVALDVYPEWSGNWSPTWPNSPLRTLVELEQNPIWFYMNCISMYTGRSLSLRKDILSAFKGVENLMASRFGARFVYGLPTSHFDLALLWEPTAYQEHRRKELCKKGKEGEPGCVESDPWPEDLEFPSWAWSGWETDREQQHIGKARYINSTLEGCLTDVRLWLQQHTWIIWYIRNNNGDLRPLWNETRAFASCVQDSYASRWYGYSGVRSIYRDPLLYPDGPPPPSSSPNDKIVNTEVEADERMQHHRKRHHLHYSNRGYGHSGERRGRSQYSPGRSHSRSHSPVSQSTTTDRYESVDPRGQHTIVTHTPEVEAPLLHSDPYGRFSKPWVDQRTQESFKEIVPDHPFGVNTIHPQSPIWPTENDQIILQFWSWTAKLYVLERLGREQPGIGLARCDVADRSGDWCGSAVVGEEWLKDHAGKPVAFIALSEAKSFTNMECPNWTQYIPKHQDEMDWDLFYVMVVKFNSHRLFWERVGLGKVFKAAFDLEKDWSEIKLG